MYLYEIHCHDRASSRCGQWSPEEMVRFYAAQGYAGIVVTNHFMNGNCTVDRSLPWKAQAELFCSGYERARAEGEKYGLDVFFGFEYSANTFYTSEDCWGGNSKDSILGCDFLIYGLDKAWLLSKDEDILHLPVNTFLKMVHDEGGTVVQAHPFRLEKAYMDHISLFPTYTDGVEILNGNPNTMGRANRLAMAYAKEYGFFCTAGTDAHFPCEYLAATMLSKRASSLEELLEALRSGDAQLRLIPKAEKRENLCD